MRTGVLSITRDNKCSYFILVQSQICYFLALGLDGLSRLCETNVMYILYVCVEKSHLIHLVLRTAISYNVNTVY